MKRRTVHKITPSLQSTFDQQFWPVLVALTVLSGIALGAVLTILRGPWMWGSLLVLPVLAALAIFLLFNIDNNRLRRSLQFAIISSLALHLLVLVFASVVNIFQNPFKPNEREVVAQRPVRTIEISDQRASFVWEETNAQETPEPVVETERQKKPTTNVQPQPVPVVETKPEINPQLVRRETTAQSVPRQSRELSQLRRQNRNLQPKSSQQMTKNKTAENKNSPTDSNPAKKLESSKKADNIARQSASNPSAAQRQSNSEPGPSSTAPESTSQPVARSSSSPRNARPSQSTAQTAPQPSPSKARVTRSTPRLPIATQKTPTSERIAEATTVQPAPSQPSKSAGELTRRPIKSRTSRPSLMNRPKTELSPRPQVAKTIQRQSNAPTRPSISTASSTTSVPRRSTTESQIVTSTVQLEKPARAPESKSASTQLNSKTLSVSRSTAGVAGAGRAKNLDRFTGGINSPASRASDSARRERTQSNASEPRMLTSSQKPVSRRSAGAARMPTSAFKSETTAAARIAGAKSTSEQTVESSAATVNSASTNHRDDISAEKGTASVDLGATKVVTDHLSERRSGGGQQEVAQLNPESTRRSNDRSDQQPSLVASTIADVSAPRNQSSAAPSTNALEAASQSEFAARAGGESAISSQRSSAASAGEISDAGQTNVSRQLADSRKRASRNQDESGWNEDDEDEDEENKRGTARTRIAQAPITQSEPGFGTAEQGSASVAAANQPSDSPGESITSKINRQASTAVPGAGIGRMATDVLLQAATSLPVIESATGQRNGRRQGTGTGTTQRNGGSTGTGIASDPKPRGLRTTKANLAPTLSGESVAESSKVSSVATNDIANLDSSSVTISRSQNPASEQVQGSELDVDAIEGPAGLGIRPSAEIGVMARPASRESEQLQPDMKSRFRSQKFGGTPSMNPDVVIAQEAFRSRSPKALAQGAEPTTEASIHLGLEFLARHQSADGSWSLSGFDRDEPQYLNQLESDTAATGLALLAFQGAGYNHREFKYARQVDHAIQWLIENQGPDGRLYVSSESDPVCRMYSHGIAALALSEAYGMTQDANLKKPAQKAIDFIVKMQDPRKGGWRYDDRPGKLSTDTSVSGWMMMAMQSGRLAGLRVDDDSFESIGNWLDVAADPDNISRYRYDPFATNSNGVSRIQGRRPTISITSVGLLMRIYSGWDRNDPRLLAGADYLVNNQLPSDSTPLLRDTYYWYYATQVLKYVDGPQWKTWNDQLRPLLIRSQEKEGDFAGSWHPYRPVPDRWGSFGGRIYVTTMNLLSLEVRHRMLPLYRQGKPKEESLTSNSD